MLLLVEVFVPTLNAHYDLFIPRNASVQEILPLITNIAERYANFTFSKETKEHAVLCDGETGQIYSYRMTVNDMGLKNGSRLLLI